MGNHVFLESVRRKKSAILFLGVVFSSLALAFVLLSGSAYKAQTDYLVSQEGMEAKDYYTVARSAEYMGKVLGEVVYSEKFIDTALATGKMNADALPMDKRDRLRKWTSIVKIEKRLDLGILTVTVFHDNQKDAMKISQAIAQVLTEKNNLFLGNGDTPVPVSILSGPILEKNPSLTEVLLATIGGFFLGVLLSIFRLFLRLEVFRDEIQQRREI